MIYLKDVLELMPHEKKFRLMNHKYAKGVVCVSRELLEKRYDVTKMKVATISTYINTFEEYGGNELVVDKFIENQDLEDINITINKVMLTDDDEKTLRRLLEKAACCN